MPDLRAVEQTKQSRMPAVSSSILAINAGSSSVKFVIFDAGESSHVNHNTAGGLAEGGYLGFAELQYVHMPLPGEKLVVFLSDGAFEEQRGSDWVPRWWRAKDCGLVAPMMINNGRRIDQSTTISQKGGVTWFCLHPELNGFDPIVFDHRDPAAFLWAILEIEARLTAAGEDARSGKSKYPVHQPYGIAVAPKGAGFPGEGTTLAHNLPLLANPSKDSDAAAPFNEGAQKLWAPQLELRTGISVFQRHARSASPLERDNVFVDRKPQLSAPPRIPLRQLGYADRNNPAEWTSTSPMAALDDEQSHQDPGLAEALLAESISVSRVLFPVDFNSAAAATARVFETRGQIWTLVVPKVDTIPNILTPAEARQLVDDGGLRLDWASHEPDKAQVILAAIGSYQLLEVLAAARRLKQRGIRHLVVCIQEPARFRTNFAEDEVERRAPDAVMKSLFPASVAARLFLTHTRPHAIWGIFGPHSTNRMSVLGYVNEGGTLNTPGMLFINACTWAHCVAEVANLLRLPEDRFLSEQELAALKGHLNPHGVIIPLPGE